MAEGPSAVGLSLAGTRPAAVFELLLFQAGRSVSTSTLIDELWPDAPPSSARNSVQRFVADIRSALGDDRALLVTTADGYLLDVDPAGTDAHRVAQLRAEAGRLLDGAGDDRTMLDAGSQSLSEALALIPVSFAVDGATPTATRARQRWHDDRLVMLEQRIEADLALGRGADLVGELGELVDAHPYREGLWGQLMRALSQQGRQTEALRAYGRLRDRLVDELGIEPSPELRRIELSILRATDEPVASEPVTTPPPMTPPPTRPRRSRRRTTMIGRDDQLVELSDSLDAGGITTLVGPGGVGKTTLAIAASDAAHTDAVFVRLTETSTDDGVLGVVVHALGLETSSTATDELESELVDALRVDPRPVVLDNAEHVMQGAADAALLLDERAGVPVLVTSREPLDLPGEHVLRLRPLEVPRRRPDGTTDAERAFSAAARRAGVELDDDDLELAADVCRRLDGLPLALELAAAQLAHLGLSELAERLADSDDIVARRRGASERHGSLRSLVQWSWDRLDHDERELLRCLTSFRTPVPLSIVELAGATPPVMSSLVARSLVVADRDGHSVRYSMLETVRRFTLDTIATDADADRYATVHAEAMLAFLRRPHAAELARWTDTMRTVVPHRADIVAALDHLSDARRVGDVLDLTARMASLWAQLGPGSELQRRAEIVERLVEGCDLTARERSAFLSIKIEAAFRRLDYPTLLDAGEALIAHEADAPTDLGVLARSFIAVLGFNASLDQRFEDIALQAYADAEHTEPSALNRSHVLQWVGCCELARFDLDAAEHSFRTSLAATTRHGGIIWSELGLVTAQLLMGRIDEAFRATADTRTTRDDTAWGYVVEVIGAVLLASAGHVDDARRRLIRSSREVTSDHLLGRHDDHRIGFGIVARIAGDHDLADELLETTCPANPVSAVLLVYFATRTPPAPESWRASWLAEIPTRNRSPETGGPPDAATLRHWAPGIDVDAELGAHG